MTRKEWEAWGERFTHEPGDFVRVAAPSGYANALLNGSEAIVESCNAELGVVTVLLLTGPDACRQWQFEPDHLVLA